MYPFYSGFNATSVKPGNIKYVHYLMGVEMMGDKQSTLAQIATWKKLKTGSGSHFHKVLFLEQKIYQEPFLVITLKTDCLRNWSRKD